MYLYHFVPQNLVGHSLYTLNQLKQKYPKLYEQHNQKYDWRPEVKESLIPGIGKWNDAIHMMAIDPHTVVQALKSFGLWQGKPWRIYKIPIDSLDPTKLVLMQPLKNPGVQRVFEKYSKYSGELPKIYTELPPITLDYYAECQTKGDLPLIYNGSPHVFYGGNIDTTGLKVVEVS